MKFSQLDESAVINAYASISANLTSTYPAAIDAARVARVHYCATNPAPSFVDVGIADDAVEDATDAVQYADAKATAAAVRAAYDVDVETHFNAAHATAAAATRTLLTIGNTDSHSFIFIQTGCCVPGVDDAKLFTDFGEDEPDGVFVCAYNAPVSITYHGER